MKEITIYVTQLSELPIAYERAVAKYIEEVGDVWNAKIELIQINFEKNFRRSTYECVFKITEGDFLGCYR